MKVAAADVQVIFDRPHRARTGYGCDAAAVAEVASHIAVSHSRRAATLDQQFAGGDVGADEQVTAVHGRAGLDGDLGGVTAPPSVTDLVGMPGGSGARQRQCVDTGAVASKNF